MGVTCQILINKPREGVYKSGKTVSGAVKYAVDEPTEYQDVTLSFLGKGKCCWSQSNGKSSTYYEGKEEYITQHVNITKKEQEKTITLHGVYEHPFEFYIPENIPTSYKEGKNPAGSITYSVQLKFVKPSFFSFNNVFSAEIPVYGYVDMTTSEGVPAADVPIIFGLEKFLFAPFSVKKPMVHLKAEIAKACLTPGENVHLSYVVTNHTGLAVISVQAALYCYVTYNSDGGSTRKWNYKVKQCEVESPPVPEGEVRNFTCVVPTLPELYSIQHSKIIVREYRVRMTVELPLPNRNAVAEMPIVIGERKGCVETCVEALDDAELQPPSYWEAMSEEKENEKS